MDSSLPPKSTGVDPLQIWGPGPSAEGTSIETSMVGYIRFGLDSIERSYF